MEQENDQIITNIANHCCYLYIVANVLQKMAANMSMSYMKFVGAKKSFAFRRTEQKKAKANATKQETKTKLQCLTEIVASNSDDYKQERHSSVTTLQSRHAKRAKHVQEFATTSLIALQQLFNTI
ncbi:hypothetical protein GQX74_001368 [Glossina fuscipes]|nr:hypothetical protein GQX74_001368 [Glossina fuscipes]